MALPSNYERDGKPSNRGIVNESKLQPQKGIARDNRFGCPVC